MSWIGIAVVVGAIGLHGLIMRRELDRLRRRLIAVESAVVAGSLAHERITMQFLRQLRPKDFAETDVVEMDVPPEAR